MEIAFACRQIKDKLILLTEQVFLACVLYYAMQHTVCNQFYGSVKVQLNSFHI